MKTGLLASLTSFALVLVLGGGGCEALVSGSLPAEVSCIDAPGACPPGARCVGGFCTTCPSGNCGDVDATVDTGTDGGGPDTTTDDTNPLPDVPTPDVPIMPEAAPDTDTGPLLGALASACAGPGACQSAICGDSLVLGPSVIAQTPGMTSVCTKPCCTSTDCDDPNVPGLVCYDTGLGGAYCVRPGWVSREVPIMTRAPGAACTAGTDCRSGSCTNSKCQDTCCNAAECTNGTSCAYATFGPNKVWTCVATSPTNDPICQSATGGAGGDFCASSNNCQGSLCLDYGFPNGCGACAQPCCKSSDCSLLQGNTTSYCIYAQLMGGDVFRGCTGTTAPSGKAFGTPCTTDTECGSGICSPMPSKLCTDVCCTDQDCAEPLPHCRPDAVTLPNNSPATVLTCQP